MKKTYFYYFILLIIFGILIFMSGCKQGGEYDITGTWNISFTNPENNETETVTYTFSGNIESGTVVSNTGAAGEFTINEKHISFFLIFDFNDVGKVINKYSGSFVNENKLDGTYRQTFELYPITAYNGLWTGNRL